MLQRLIHATQVICLLAVILQGLRFVIGGTTPTAFVSLVYVILSVGVVFTITAGVDRWVV